MERVVAALLERYRGRLPLWLAPVQVCVMPIGPAHDAAHDLVNDLLAAGLRARLETQGSLGSRIHASRQRRDCLIAVLGQAEIDTHQVQVTDIAAGFNGPVARDRFIQTLQSCTRRARVRCSEKTSRPSAARVP
jgi:threonyl-tRNA synthetase